MAIDMQKMADMAKTMIEDNGRACTFSRLGRDPADSTKPWRGATTSGVAAHPPVSYSSVKAVIFPEEVKVANGQIVRTGYETLLVAEESFPTGHVDPATMDKVNDGLKTWTVKSVMPLTPGATTVIFQFTLES